MKLGLQLEGIYKHGYYNNLMKNGILYILLKNINKKKDGCFGIIFIGIYKIKDFFRRKIEV